MTYEQASARGLVIRKYDGAEMRYAETVRNHFVTSMGTAETVAENREQFLEDFYAYQRSAIDEGSNESIRAYILPAQADQAAADKLAGLLVRQGAEVGMATEGFRACRQSFDAGSYVINLDQPAKRLIRTLMDNDVPIDESFMAEQERRRAKGLPDEIYDVTAWSLPLMLNVEAVPCSRKVVVASTPAEPVFTKPGSYDMRPKSSSEVLICRKSMARTVPYSTGISYSRPVRLSRIDSVSLAIAHLLASQRNFPKAEIDCHGTAAVAIGAAVPASHCSPG